MIPADFKVWDWALNLLHILVYAVSISLILIPILIVGFSSCGNEETIDTPVAIEQAPAAPNANADEDIPVGWTAENLEVDRWVTTATEIVMWISYEEDGITSVSRQVRIPK